MLNNVQTDCTGYELALGSITGYRRFSVDQLGRLCGLHLHSVWKPGENVAKCRAVKHEDKCVSYISRGWCRCPESNGAALHDADGCPCGFYAYLDITETRYGDIKRLGMTVGGIVSGYGKTLIGTKGFRCEKAEIKALVIPRRTRIRRRSIVKKLRANYPDVEVFTSKRRAAQAFGVSLETAARPETDPDFWTRKSTVL